MKKKRKKKRKKKKKKNNFKKMLKFWLLRPKVKTQNLNLVQDVFSELIKIRKENKRRTKRKNKRKNKIMAINFYYKIVKIVIKWPIVIFVIDKFAKTT